MNEIEVKLVVEGDPEDMRGKLRTLGATESAPRLFEDNRLYDTPGRDLGRSHRILRLRSVGARHVVTFKAPLNETPDDSRYKIRIEHETTVGDPEVVARIFDGLGYAPAWRYQKFRHSFRLGGLHIELDETPIGTFLELEGPQDEIDGAAASLGFGPADYVTKTYRDLATEHGGGGEPADLLFPPPVPGEASTPG